MTDFVEREPLPFPSLANAPDFSFSLSFQYFLTFAGVNSNFGFMLFLSSHLRSFLLRRMARVSALAAMMTGGGLASTNDAQAKDMNAGVVMDDMNSDQRAGYVMGVIDGLAYARFVRDKPSEKGMKCIYDWYYKDNAERWKSTLFPMFERHRDKPVSTILYVLTKKECGE